MRTLTATFASAVMACSLTVSSVFAQHHQDDHDGHDHGAEEHHDDHAGHDDHHSDHTEITPEMAQQVGISIGIAAPGIIQRTVTAYGRLRPPPGRISHVRARFPGMITEVNAQVGERVSAGDVLARVESNETLNNYGVAAPIAGVVLERHASVGEVASEQALFTVADLTRLWAELKVFPGQRDHVRAGQRVLVRVGEAELEGTIAHLLPEMDEAFSVARVELDNTGGRWSPGLLVQGAIAVETFEVPVRIENRALQTMEGRPVVFVQEGDAFHTRPVKLGKSDDQYAHIKSGLEPGERYVVDNSYLIKADIEKSGAAHHH